MFKASSDQDHYKVATMVHWKLCSKYGFEPAKHWYEHRAEGVMENRDTEILWNFNIRTDHVIEARCPDIVLRDKKNQEAFIIEVAIPGDIRVRDKEAEKISKYQDLALKTFQIWNSKTRVIPMVIGALGAESLLTEYLALIGVMTRRCDNMQQTAVLGSAHTLRKALSIPV